MYYCVFWWVFKGGEESKNGLNVSLNSRKTRNYHNKMTKEAVKDRKVTGHRQTIATEGNIGMISRIFTVIPKPSVCKTSVESG